MSARLVKARWAAAIIAMGLIAATPWAVQAYRGGPSSLTVEIDVPLYTIEEGSAGRERRVAVDGYVSEYAQGLGLPEGGILLGVPVNGGDFRIVSVESSFQLVHTGLGPNGGPRRLATEGERAEAAATWANNDIVEMGEMGFLRYQRFLRLTLRPVQYNQSNGQLAYHPDITVKIEYTKGAVDGFSSAGNEDSEVFEDIYAQAIHNYDQARKWRVRPDPEAPDSALTEALSATDAQAFKLAIDQDGLHRVSH